MSVVYPNWALSEAGGGCRETTLAEPAAGGVGAGTGPSGLEVNTGVLLLAWGFAKDF